MDKCVYYVYALCNPITCKVFYIGKGKGYRAKAHKRECLNIEVRNSLKHLEIESILAAGKDIVIKIIKSNLCEQDAFILEREYIAKFKNRLTNIAFGEKHKNERELAKTQSMIDRLIPFDEWAAKFNPDDFAKNLYWYVVNALRDNKRKILACR